MHEHPAREQAVAVVVTVQTPSRFYEHGHMPCPPAGLYDLRSSCLRATLRMFNRSGVVVRFSWRTHEHAAQERGLADAGRPHDPRARQFCDDVFAVDPLEGCIWPEVRPEVSQYMSVK